MEGRREVDCGLGVDRAGGRRVRCISASAASVALRVLLRRRFGLSSSFLGAIMRRERWSGGLYIGGQVKNSAVVAPAIVAVVRP